MTGAVTGVDGLVAALRAVPLLAPVTDAALRHYAAHGVELRVPTGGTFAVEGDTRAWFHVLLEGRVEWTRQVGGAAGHVLTHTAGEYFGHEPILLDIPVPVTGTALEDSRALRFDAAEFWELLSSCPEVRRELLSAVSQRVQTLEGVSAQQARLAALGTLAAGLAHELNNPAAAVRAGIDALAATLTDVSAAALRVGRAVPDGAVAAAVGRWRAATPGGPDAGSAVERADAEDAVADWLSDHGVERPWDRAAVLAAAGVTAERLDELAGLVPGPALADTAAWLAAGLAGEQVLDEMRASSARISELVSAMRRYTYLDQAPEQDVDVHDGLDATLTVLAERLGAGVEVRRDYAADMPRISARGSELNQVWTQLVTNAVDAMAGAGRLTVTTRRDGPRVLVDVADTGSGIPADLHPRIFDPYFTTKPVGRGAGLGLDVARRIVESHGGDLRFTSHPGETHFTVRLPAPAPPPEPAG